MPDLAVQYRMLWGAQVRSGGVGNLNFSFTLGQTAAHPWMSMSVDATYSKMAAVPDVVV